MYSFSSPLLNENILIFDLYTISTIELERRYGFLRNNARKIASTEVDTAQSGTMTDESVSMYAFEKHANRTYSNTHTPTLSPLDLDSLADKASSVCPWLSNSRTNEAVSQREFNPKVYSGVKQDWVRQPVDSASSSTATNKNDDFYTNIWRSFLQLNLLALTRNGSLRTVKKSKVVAKVLLVIMRKFRLIFICII
jgi:hypothetical protein